MMYICESGDFFFLETRSSASIIKDHQNQQITFLTISSVSDTTDVVVVVIIILQQQQQILKFASSKTTGGNLLRLNLHTFITFVNSVFISEIIPFIIAHSAMMMM